MNISTLVYCLRAYIIIYNIKDLELKQNGVPLKHLSRRTVTRKIDQMFDVKMNSIREEIGKVTVVCTTADIWTSTSRRFMGVTVHWIDHITLERKSAAVACRRFTGTHTYNRIARMLNDINLSLNLDPEKIIATVTDNGSNFVKAFKEFGVDASNFSSDLTMESSYSQTVDSSESEEEEQTDFYGDDADSCMIAEYESTDDAINMLLPKHLRCGSHTLSLIATTDTLRAMKKNRDLFDVYNVVIERCNILWRATRSPKKNEIMREVLGVALLKPVVVRWNSLYDAMKRIILVKDRLSEVNLALNIQNKLLDEDFEFIEKYLKCLKPIADAIDKLQGEKSCSFGYLLPVLLTTRRKLQTLCHDNELNSFQPLLLALVDAIAERFNNYFNIENEGEAAAIAAMTHPFFKAHWIQCLNESLQNKVRTSVIKAAQAVVNKECVLSSIPFVITDETGFFDFGPSTSTFGTSSGNVELNADLEVEILKFSKERRTDLQLLDSYPLVRKLFIHYNTALPSSAPVERLFSYATMMNLPKYNRLRDECFEKRVLCIANSLSS